MNKFKIIRLLVELLFIIIFVVAIAVAASSWWQLALAPKAETPRERPKPKTQVERAEAFCHPYRVTKIRQTFTGVRYECEPGND